MNVYVHINRFTTDIDTDTLTDIYIFKDQDRYMYIYIYTIQSRIYIGMLQIASEDGVGGSLDGGKTYMWEYMVSDAHSAMKSSYGYVLLLCCCVAALLCCSVAVLQCCNVLYCVAVRHICGSIWFLYGFTRSLSYEKFVRVCLAVCCSVLLCGAVCCSVLQCVAVWCSVLQCDAVCCCVLQCVSVCCSKILVWEYIVSNSHSAIKGRTGMRCSVLQCVAVCCSAMQCVAECCCVLLRVVECFSFTVRL